jgi:steroid 5-alpha reductase family enzyme
MAAGLLTFPFVLKISAPYGRHTSSRWGMLIDNRVGWILMESPALVLFAYFFLSGTGSKPMLVWIFFSLWVIHYVNRTLIFPFRLRTKGKKMPLAIVFMALGFNFVNGFINGYFLGTLASSSDYPLSYLYDPRFIFGILMFFTGMWINWQSDHMLIHLRKPGETGYIIPRGRLFRYISCPNHFGELVEWSGFALMVWNAPAVAFALWTAVNLIPRALQHHQWYREKFADYPESRKAVIPFLL